MISVRNPFRLQTSERISSEVDFLRMFEPQAIGLLPEEALDGKVLFVRSSPGGGKTTLLRLFTAGVLRTLLSLKGSDPFRHIFLRLKKIGAISDNEILLHGIPVSCQLTFPALGDLGFSRELENRYLMALLDAKICLGALRSLFSAYGRRYPEDLPDVELRFFAKQVRADEFAKDMLRIEEQICQTIDSLDPEAADRGIGQTNLHNFRMLEGCCVVLGPDQEVSPRWHVMLDDAHRLTRNQRSSLSDFFVNRREASPIWVAERYEALNPIEMLSVGAKESRDHYVVSLEESWIEKRGRPFQKTVMSIAEKRMKAAEDLASGRVHIGSFAGSLSTGAMRSAEEDAANKLEEVMVLKYGDLIRYRHWLEGVRESDSLGIERCVEFMTLRILIERDMRKRQLGLEFSLERDEYQERLSSSVRAAAKLFVSKLYGLPYYYGADTVADLGSANIEQFLYFAGDLFEEALGLALLTKEPEVAPARQEQIIRDAVKKRFSAIPKLAPGGRAVRDFLVAVGKFCRTKTFELNAPYAPGVTGIAISMDDREKMMDEDWLASRVQMSNLRRVLTTALSLNLFQAKLDVSNKKKRWMVMYLNRYLCVHFGLPLQYGGWREQRLSTLVSWQQRGFIEQENNSKQLELV